VCVGNTPRIHPVNYAKSKSGLNVSPELIKRRCAHVIDLGALRASVGPLWGSIEEAVQSRMATLMSTQLSIADCYEKLDDTHHLIISPSAEMEDGALLAVRVGCEFLKSLEDKCDLSNLRIDVAERITSDGMQSTPIRMDRLARLVEQAQVTDVIFPPHLRRARLRSPLKTTAGDPHAECCAQAIASSRFGTHIKKQLQLTFSYLMKLCAPVPIFRYRLTSKN
jgi:hypothetical protein